MPLSLNDKTVTWVDNGLFIDFALACAKDFGKSNYFSPWVSSFPLSNNLLPGDGFPELQRLKWFWDEVDTTDLFVFPDVYFGDVQEHLVSIGKRVWGGRKGEFLELYRQSSKEIMEAHGLPVAPFEVVSGIDDLRAWLRTHPRTWVKISLTRGDMETWFSESYDLSKEFIDGLEFRLGAKARLMRFICEEAIPKDKDEPCIETGYDGYCVDGQFPKNGFFGFEIKDKGYIIKCLPYGELPKQVRQVNDALAPWLKEKQYRGFFSTEIRITQDGTPYCIDPCCRCGSPPNEIYQELVSNWSEILWEGAGGNLVEPEFKHKYGVEVLIHSPRAAKEWVPVRFPEEIRPYVKFRNHCKIGGLDYFVPQPPSELPEIGAVLGVGETIEEAVEHCKANAEQIKAYDLDIQLDSIDDAMKEIEKAKDFGIEI